LSFLNLTGLSRLAFNELFYVLFLDEQIKRTGRPQLMHPSAQLGFYLFYIGSTMGNKHLCLIFGITPSACSEILNKMLLLVVGKLKGHPIAEVKFPDAEKMERFARQINQCEPIVDDVICYMDGLTLQSKCISKPIMQNSMYSGYYEPSLAARAAAGAKMVEG
jgi:hypothetical protein